MNFFTVLNVLGLGVLVWWFGRYWRQTALRLAYWPGLVLKLLAGWLLGWLYYNYYGQGDTLEFYNYATQLAEAAGQAPGHYIQFLFGFDAGPFDAQLPQLAQAAPRVLFFVKILSVVAVLTGSQYWLMGLYLSLFSFLGMFYLAIVMHRHLNSRPVPLALAFLFFPSVVFWSSGVLKESLMVGLLGFAIGAFITFYQAKKANWLYLVLVGILVWLLFNFKYYYAAVLVPVLVTAYTIKVLQANNEVLRHKPGIMLRFWFLVFIVLLLVASSLHPNLQPANFLQAIVTNHNLTLEASQPHSMVHFYELQPTWGSVLLNAPLALCTGLFRPTIIEAATMTHVPAAVDNTLVLVLVFMAIWQYKRWKPLKLTPLLVGLFVYCGVLAIFLSLSAPNLGAIFRYRVGYMPLFVYLLFEANPALLGFVARLRHALSSQGQGK